MAAFVLPHLLTPAAFAMDGRRPWGFVAALHPPSSRSPSGRTISLPGMVARS